MKRLIKEEYWDYTTIIWSCKKSVFNVPAVSYGLQPDIISSQTVDNPKTCLRHLLKWR